MALAIVPGVLGLWGAYGGPAFTVMIVQGLTPVGSFALFVLGLGGGAGLFCGSSYLSIICCDLPEGGEPTSLTKPSTRKTNNPAFNQFKKAAQDMKDDDAWFEKSPK